MKKVKAIILAGGNGSRFGGEVPKQFIKIAGRTVIEHTIDRMEKNDLIDSIIAVVNQTYFDKMNDLVLKNNFTKLDKIVKGGSTRQESSYYGLQACDDDTDKVLLHDAVRPFVSDRIIEDVILALDHYGAVDVAISSADTIIKLNEKNVIESIPERRHLMRGQTPQGFRFQLIKKAYDMFRQDHSVSVTDDCGLVVKYGLGSVYVVKGEEKNIKITYPEDVYLADKLFQINSNLILLNEIDEKKIFRLKDKVTVIFGHSSGIGKQVHDTLSRCDTRVFGFSRGNGVDVGDYRQVEKTLADVYRQTRRIDYVINTAGVLSIGKLENFKIENIEEQVRTNYYGMVNTTKASIPYLRETGGNLCLFTSSSYTRGRALYSIYSSTKAATVNFVQAISEELLGEGIRINVINPERTATPMRTRNFGCEPKESLLDPAKVATATINLLLSDITGQIIDVRKD